MRVCVCFEGKLCICVDIFQCMWADHSAQGEHIFLGIFRYSVPFAWREHSEQWICVTDVCVCVCVCSHVSYAALLRRQKEDPILAVSLMSSKDICAKKSCILAP